MNKSLNNFEADIIFRKEYTQRFGLKFADIGRFLRSFFISHRNVNA